MANTVSVAQSNPPVMPMQTWGPIGSMTSWGRAGGGKWHLLLDFRRFVGPAPHQSWYSSLRPGQLFAPTACGQIVADPAQMADPKQINTANWSSLNIPVPVPGEVTSAQSVCVTCLETLARHLQSVSI